MSKKKIASVIPAFNASDTIEEVLEGLRMHLPDDKIIVVDDGSEIEFRQPVEALGATYLRHSGNQGKGAALWTGFQAALEQGGELILTLDADGQHDPADAPKLIAAMASGNYDVVIGSRMDNLQKMPAHRVLSNVMTSRLLSLRIGQKLDDSQSGFRLITREAISGVSPQCTRFDFESELLIKFGQAGYRIGFVPVQTKYPGDADSAMKLQDVFRFIRMYVNSYFWRKS